MRTRHIAVPLATAAVAATLVITPSAAAQPATGPVSTARVVTLESVNFPGHVVRHRDTAGRIDPVGPNSSAQDRADATFTLAPGLSDPDCYSFQAVDGRFLRHQDFQVVLATNTGVQPFLDDATFCPAPGAEAGTTTFAPVNYPGHRLRHRDFALRVDPVADTAAFRGDSTFRVRSPLRPRTRANPVLPGLHADPHAMRFGDRYYVYPTSDGRAGWASPYYTAWSSPDLRTWTPHGIIMDLRPDVTWADDSAWAPGVAERDGRYYLYFSGGRTGGPKELGVAVANSPVGPFRDALGRPLVRAGAYPGQAIDPMVFTDTDGRAYLYWGNGGAYAVPLNDDMVSFDPAQVRTITPPGYREGAFVFERAGTYYFMWSENDTGDEDYRVAYATGTSPLGPWTPRGTVLSKDLAIGVRGPGHHSVVAGPGRDEWHIVYHRFAVPAGNGTNREVAIDRMEFDAAGLIRPVRVTP